MIDTHAHTLFEVDDGAKDFNMSLEMLQLAIDNKTKGIILTPHYQVPKYKNDHVAENYEKLKTFLKENDNYDIKVYLGNEIYLDDAGYEGLMNKKAYTMANSDFVLIELPFFKMYQYHENLLDSIEQEGYKIIIAHVDRYDYLMKNEDEMQKFLEKGYFLQMTAKYLTKPATQRNALKLIEKGYIHLVASDMHNTTSRNPDLLSAYNIVKNNFGIRVANTLFVSNGANVVLNRSIKGVESFAKKNNNLINRVINKIYRKR